MMDCEYAIRNSHGLRAKMGPDIMQPAATWLQLNVFSGYIRPIPDCSMQVTLQTGCMRLSRQAGANWQSAPEGMGKFYYVAC